MPSDLELLVRLAVACAMGAVLGVERELADQPAGLRTHVLLSLGACLFTLVSAYGFGRGDPTRIAAQVVSGIGFLGGGAILRQGLSVRGLTTAASIWAAAALGVTVGAGRYALGVGATALALVTLAGMRVLRNALRRFSVTRQELIITTGPGFELPALLELASADGAGLRRLDHEHDHDGGRVAMRVRLPHGYPPDRFLERVSALPGVRGLEWES